MTRRSEAADLDSDRLLDAMRAKAPRACALADRVRAAVDTLPAGPMRERLELTLLDLSLRADSGQEATGTDAQMVAALLAETTEVVLRRLI